MIRIMGEFTIEFIGLKYCAKGLGDPRLVPLSLGCDSFTWGVTLGGHIVLGPEVYFTYLGTVGVDSPTTYL
jgi:hypothetical protein